MAKIAREETFEPGAIVFKENDEATTLYIILEGRVAVLIDIGGGRKTNVDTITKGETLGWSAMVPPHTMTAAAKAVERTRVVAIPAGGDARILLDELPDVLYNHGEPGADHRGQAAGYPAATDQPDARLAGATPDPE